MSEDQNVEFGWTEKGPTEAHGYLLPSLLQQLNVFIGHRNISILDIGCGNGYITAQLAKLGHHVTGVDTSLDGLEIARAAYPELELHQKSVYDEDFPGFLNRKFDLVISLEVLEHLMLPSKMMEKSYEALEPGGLLLVSTPYHGYLKNLAISMINGWDKHFGVHGEGGHVKFFSKRTLKEMAVSAGFEPLAFSGSGRIPWLWKSMFMVARR